MADDVSIKFGGEIAALTAAMKQATDGVKNFAEQSKRAVEGLTAPFEQLKSIMLGIAALAAGGAMFKDIIDSTLQTTSEVTKLQKAFGLNLEEANKTSGSLKVLGIATEDYIGFALRLDRQIRTNNESLQKMGFTARDLDLGQKGLMDKAIAKLLEYKEGVDRNIASGVLFGRNVQEIYPILRLAIEGVSERAEQLHKQLGLTVTEDDKTRAREYRTSMNELGMAFDGIKKSIGEHVLPYLTKFSRWFTDQAPSIITGMKETVRVVIEWAFSAAESLVSFTANVITTMNQMLTLATFIGNFLGVVTDKGAGDFINRLAAVGDAVLKVKENVLAGIAKIKAEVLGGGPGDTKPGEGLPPGTKSASNLISDKSGISARATEIEEAIQAEQAKLARMKVLFSEEAESYKITQQQKFLFTETAIQQAYEAEMVQIARKEKLYAGDVANFAKTEKEKAKLTEQYQFDMVKTVRASQHEMTKEIEGNLKLVQSAFDSQLSGLLNGTKSWSQAMVGAIQSLVMSIIRKFEDWAVTQASIFLADSLLQKTKAAADVGTHVAAEGAKTAATVTGAAARTGAEAASSGAIMAAKIGETMSAIFADVAKTFSGIVAFLSSFLGPAAIPVALGLSAGVAALAFGKLPKFDDGTDRVMKTGLAIIHQGEQITPAQGSGPYTGGGDTHVHLHGPFVSAIDTQTGMQFLNRNIDQFAAKLSAHYARNPSTRPAY